MLHSSNQQWTSELRLSYNAAMHDKDDILRLTSLASRAG
jgi:hypothetical protein